MLYKPPFNVSKRDFKKKSIFLAGSIEMGSAEDWQREIGSRLYVNWNVFNPRRDDWDSTWVQEFENPQFSQQVRWELDALDKADVIVIYFLKYCYVFVHCPEFLLFFLFLKTLVRNFFYFSYFSCYLRELYHFYCELYQLN
jgi:hypothetical protein